MARLRGEEGFTVVAAMIVVLIGLLFTTAAIGQALSTESSVRRDGSSKRALQAAKAGVEAGSYWMTALSDRLGAAKNSYVCPVVDPATGAITLQTRSAPSVGGPSWCPRIQQRIGSGETTNYWVSADLQPTKRMTDERDVVATGVSADGARRVKTRWSMFDIRQLFWDYTVFSDRDLNLSNQADVGSPTITGNAGSNGNIYLNNPGNVVYGDATPGPGKSVVISGGTVSGAKTPATEPLNLPAVDPTVAAVNDNALICTPTCPAGVTFANQDLVISGDNVTITGNTFLVCSLSMTGQGNPTITFQPLDANRPVRIFIKDQTQCGGTRPANVLTVGQKPLITVASSLYPSLQLFVAGDPSRPTSIDIGNNNPTLPITLYAPTSNVSIANNGTISGGIAARSVTMTNSTQIVFPSGGGSLDLEIPPEIEPGDFVECTTSVDDAQTLDLVGC